MLEPVKYEWKSNARIKIDPAIAGAECSRIARRDGDVDPVVLVNENREVGAPLHSYFEWNNDIAADQHRLFQSRYLLRHLVVVVKKTETDETLPPVRAMVRLTRAAEQEQEYRYLPIVKVMENPELRARYVRDALNELVQWRQRYHDIEEFTSLAAAIDELHEQLSEHLAK